MVIFLFRDEGLTEPRRAEYPFFRRLMREVAKMQKKDEYPKERLMVWRNY